MLPDASLPTSGSEAAAKGLKSFVAVAGGASTLLSIVNDVLVPQGFLALGLCVAAGVGLAISSLPERGFPAVHRLARSRLNGLWQRPLQVALAVSMAISGLAYGISASAPPGGWLGANVPAVHDLQGSLGIVSANIEKIGTDVTAIRNDLGNVKQETSKDPRKELANLGVTWTTQAFVDALKLGDERTVKLFLDGGMSPLALNNGASAIVFLLQPGLTVDPTPTLTLLVDQGYDLNANMVDDYIMPDTNGYIPLPPNFESTDPPLVINSGHFVGPALLWVVIEASYYVPTDHDFTTIRFLLDHKVDKRLALKYMADTKSWNGDTDPYQAISKALGT